MHEFFNTLLRVRNVNMSLPIVSVCYKVEELEEQAGNTPLRFLHCDVLAHLSLSPLFLHISSIRCIRFMTFFSFLDYSIVFDACIRDL